MRQALDRVREVRHAVDDAVADGTHRYQIAAKALVHPSALSRMLTGRQPLPDDVAERILRACQAQS